ncbi:MAG: ABC-2 type transport system permease protein [Parcubacteria group bacterium Gr01-1014_38]|nr:MAG: ABC-2 type transport system permease protein [Parcubacteria group bacterium Gr01-1014_38]
MMRQNLTRTWELIWTLAKTDWKVRYSGSRLGYLWAVLKPLLIFATLYTVFSIPFGRGVPMYAAELLIGILFWNYFAEGTSTGMQSLFAKGHILTKVPVSLWTIAAASTLQVTLTFLLNLLVIIPFVAAQPIILRLSGLLLFLGSCVLTAMLILAISLFLAPLFVRYRDLKQLWEVLLTLGFFVTPIIYPPNMTPERLRHVLSFNPMALLIQSARSGILQPSDMSLLPLLTAAGMIGMIFAASIYIFQRTAPTVSEYL